MKYDPLAKLIDLAASLTASGEIGDGMVEQFHALAAEARAKLDKAKARSHKKRSRGPAIINRHVEDGGRRYRICTTDRGSIIIIALKSLVGGPERALDINGRRARQLLRLADEQGKST